MTQRIPLDHLTSDQLDQLYQRLDHAEAHADPELRDRLDAALTALGRAETELAALRARSHCARCLDSDKVTIGK